MAAHSLSLLSISPSPSRCRCRQPFHNPWNLDSDNLVSSFIGPKLSIRPSNYRQHYTSKRLSSVAATVSLSLPTAEPERVSPDNSPKWSARAMKSIALGGAEARKLKREKTGTETLLMGILVEGTSLAAKVLREYGLTLAIMREEIVKLLGKSDSNFIPPAEPPLTKQSQWALDWAVDEKLKSGETGEVTTNHLLLGIWSVKESAGHKILAVRGFDDQKAKELARSVSLELGLSNRLVFYV